MTTVLVVIWFVGAIITGFIMRYLSNGRTAKASEDLFGHQPESWWQRRQVRRTTRNGNLLGAILWPVLLILVLAVLAPSGIKSMLQYASTHSPSRRFLVGYGAVMLALVAAIVGVVVSKSPTKADASTATTVVLQPRESLFQDNGSGAHQWKLIAPTRAWRVKWSFSCPGGTRFGGFSIGAFEPATGSALLAGTVANGKFQSGSNDYVYDTSANSGSGITSFGGPGDPHNGHPITLTIVTGAVCTWTVSAYLEALYSG